MYLLPVLLFQKSVVSEDIQNIVYSLFDPIVEDILRPTKTSSSSQV